MLVLHHAEMYYNNTSVLTDAEYDELYDQLEAIEKLTGIVDKDSPTQNIGTSPVAKGKVKHQYKMYSLKKTYDIASITSEYSICTIKLDGAALALEQGQIITRGNGELGVNITHLKGNIKGFPDHKLPEEVVVTGEVLTDNKDITNKRNYVSGALNSKYSFDIKDKALVFIVHDVLGLELDYIDRLNWAKENNFTTVIDINEGDYPSDGLVYRVSTYAKEVEMGHTGKHPRYAIALKEKNAIMAATVIQDIYWSVGRTNVVTPVAIVDEIELDDAKISRVTLHNYQFVLDNNLGPGDTIYIERQIIPSFVKKLHESSYARFDKEHAEKQLGCDTYIDGPRLYTTSEFNIRGLQHFSKTLDIKGLGPKTIEKSGVKTIPELFTHDWVETAGEANGTKILLELNKNKEYPLVLASLGIPHCGVRMGKLLATEIPSIDDLRFELGNRKIRGIGPTIVRDILSWLDDNQYWVMELPDNLKLDYEPEAEKKFRVAITGKISGFTKTQLTKKLAEVGIEVASTLTKDCKYLITANEDTTSSKAKQAEKYGIAIIPFDQNKAKILSGKLFELLEE